MCSIINLVNNTFSASFPANFRWWRYSVPLTIVESLTMQLLLLPFPKIWCVPSTCIRWVISYIIGGLLVGDQIGLHFEFPPILSIASLFKFLIPLPVYKKLYDSTLPSLIVAINSNNTVVIRLSLSRLRLTFSWYFSKLVTSRIQKAWWKANW